MPNGWFIPRVTKPHRKDVSSYYSSSQNQLAAQGHFCHGDSGEYDFYFYEMLDCPSCSIRCPLSSVEKNCHNGCYEIQGERLITSIEKYILRLI